MEKKMKVIKNNEAYIDDVMKLFNDAIYYFKENNIDQWQNGYPNRQSIIDDIKEGNSYILIDHDKILGNMYFRIGIEPDYNYIEGKWLTSTPYAMIHRIVIDHDSKGKHLANHLLDYVINKCKENNIDSIRIDTHKDNQSMQRFLKKNGFIYCGIIYLEDGDERMAFEKLL